MEGQGYGMGRQYSWTKKRYPLTKDQRERGVVFSSALVRIGFDEEESDTIHEVMGDSPQKDEEIELLKDVSFFKTLARDAKWRIVEIVRQ